MKKISILPLAFLLLIACNQEQSEENHEQETATQEENYHHSDESIVLDNGKKMESGRNYVSLYQKHGKSSKQF